MGVVLLAACHSSPPGTSSSPVLSGNQTGAADAVSAVRGFMTAAKQQDLQAMGAIWGGPDGPARDALPRDELEKRELIMMMCLRHDRYDIVGEAPNPGGNRAIVVNLTFGTISQSSNFEVVRGPADRWFVKSFDLQALQQICSHRS